MLVLLAKPPGVTVAIIAVVLVGVLLRTFVGSSVWAGAQWPRVRDRAVADGPYGTTTDPIAYYES